MPNIHGGNENLEAMEFFQKLIAALAVADPTYSQSGEPTWVMNRKTHMDVLAKAMAFNASGALVAGMQNTMPVIAASSWSSQACLIIRSPVAYLDVYSPGGAGRSEHSEQRHPAD